MSDEYCVPDKRKTRRDKKKKRLNRAYKRGGQFRTMNISLTGNK